MITWNASSAQHLFTQHAFTYFSSIFSAIYITGLTVAGHVYTRLLLFPFFHPEDKWNCQGVTAEFQHPGAKIILFKKAHACWSSCRCASQMDQRQKAHKSLELQDVWETLKEPREGEWAISYKWIAQLRSEHEHWGFGMDELEEMCRGTQESTWPTVRNIRSFRHTLSWSHGTLLTLALLHPPHTQQGVVGSLNQKVLIFLETEHVFFLSAMKSDLLIFSFFFNSLELLI